MNFDGLVQTALYGGVAAALVGISAWVWVMRPGVRAPRDFQAVTMRFQGHDHATIAAELGYAGPEEVAMAQARVLAGPPPVPTWAYTLCMVGGGVAWCAAWIMCATDLTDGAGRRALGDAGVAVGMGVCALTARRGRRTERARAAVRHHGDRP